MGIKTKHVLSSALIIILITILFSAIIKEKNSFDEIVVNENIIQIRGFSIKSDSTEINTSAKGTIFIKGVGGIPEHVQIITWIEIDPYDWGGVAFYVPDKWHISNIISSYPENENQTISKDYVATWIPAKTEYEWSSIVEVGRDRSYIPTGGGTGTVVIDLDLNENVNDQLETFKFSVAVGSDEKDGIKTIGADHISIEIPISLTD